MNYKGVAYINKLKSLAFQRTLPTPTEEALSQTMRLNADVHALFDRFKPQDDEEKERVARAYLTYQYLTNPKNQTL